MDGVRSSDSILLVDDDRETCEVTALALSRRGFNVTTVNDAESALLQLREHDWDALVTDVRLSGKSGLELCEDLAEIRPGLPAIVITGFGNLEMAVAAIHAGAYDFITKPISLETLEHALRRAIRHRRLASEVRLLREQIAHGKRPTALIGDSAPMRQVIELVDQVAGSDATVLVTGESGTGKELVARALHERGPRANEPFVAVNCAAMPATLLESELFGHERGAFTDAKRSRAGLFVQAGRGTLFLDEIAEMPAEMQAKLLRALQERKVRPVGSDEETPFAARLVAATNRDLLEEIEQGRFREDLYYRINVVHIEVPPLRSRRGDVLELAQTFLRRHAERNQKPVVGISEAAARKLIDYDWPGNVRELENCMERAVALTRLTEITVEDLPTPVREHKSTRLVLDGDDPAAMMTLLEVERRYVQRVLAACNGNKSQAARVLGIDRRSLYRRLDGNGRSTEA